MWRLDSPSEIAVTDGKGDPIRDPATEDRENLPLPCPGQANDSLRGCDSAGGVAERTLQREARKTEPFSVQG